MQYSISPTPPNTSDINIDFLGSQVTIFSNDSNFGIDTGVLPGTTPVTYTVKIFLVAEGGN